MEMTDVYVKLGGKAENVRKRCKDLSVGSPTSSFLYISVISVLQLLHQQTLLGPEMPQFWG